MGQFWPKPSGVSASGVSVSKDGKDYWVTKVLQNIASNDDIISSFGTKRFVAPFSEIANASTNASTAFCNASRVSSTAFSNASVAICFLCATYSIGKILEICKSHFTPRNPRKPRIRREDSVVILVHDAEGKWVTPNEDE